LGGKHIEADMFFMKDGEYQFDFTKLKDAHKWCQDSVEVAMKGWEGISLPSNRIIVSNTFTQEWEMKPYYDLSEKYGYKVFSIIVENTHNGENIHNVPIEKINDMKNRFIVRL